VTGSRSRFRPALPDRRRFKPALAVLICWLFVAIGLSGGLAGPDLLASSATPVWQPPLQVAVSARTAIVIDTSRQRRLFAKSPDMRLSIPASGKMMTALLACERLPLDTPVTISNVAAAAAAQEKTGDGIILQTGDKYPLEYLLLRLLFYDSDAAALAIAEQISNVEERFVDLMNARATSLELANTVYLNSTGAPIYQQPTSPTGSDDPDTWEQEQVALQYTTAADLARLIVFAMNNQNFARLLRKDSEYLVLGGDHLVTMRNEISSIWTLSENRISGAFYCEANSRAYAIAVGKINDINVVVVTAGGSPGQRVGDLLALANAIETTYVQSPLVIAGDRFTGDQEQTVDGETFGLVFKKTVLYIHPVDDAFLESTVRYNSFGPHSRPVESALTAGQVVFQLKDGTSIAVDVGPDRQILSNITLLNQALNVLQKNRNLFVVLLASAGILLLLLFVQVMVRMSRLIRLIQLTVLERRSRR
jgi:D-alanyl-D-alanine carboxypeptidase